VLLGSALCLVLGLFTAIETPGVARAVQTNQPTLVNTTAASFTPNINPSASGVVYAIAKSGSNIYMGGSFTSISPSNAPSNSTAVTNLAAFNASTGAIVTTFKPNVNNTVWAVLPGPTPGTVYVGGSFNTINGSTSHLALIDGTTGAVVPGWKSPSMNGAVNRMVMANGQLLVGGFFTTVGGQSHQGLASLNPTTGAVTSYVPSTLTFTGHHNYGVNCTGTSCAMGAVGVKALDVTPDGTRAIVIGNFNAVSGTARDQIAMLDLASTGASLDTTWNTLAYTAPCKTASFDMDVRDVQFSPDGSYFVVVATGAGGPGALNKDGTKALCDAAGRFETNATGSDIPYTWGDWTGNDSFWSVAITGAAVYAGGHERWMNNSTGSDRALEGAVPRPGIVALDPQNGLPWAWNPGRNPRGAGAYAILATPDGLYVGSDTDYIGYFQYFHAKIAFFPIAGGEVPPPNQTGSLPGTVDLFGPPAHPSQVQPVDWDGSSAPSVDAAQTGFNASNVRGAFEVDGNLYYGTSSGGLFEAPYDGNTVGTSTAVDPYDDPYWSDKSTGSGSTTYRGLQSNFYAEIPSLTSTFYSGGRVYYTLSGKSKMFYRYFETDDGIMGSQEFTTTDSNNWSHVAGAFLSGSTIYYADSTTGNLMAVPFSGGQPSGPPVLADSSINWASHGAVVTGTPGGPSNQRPVASFTASCPAPDTACQVDGSASVDPDGSIASYKWAWGDGTTTTTTSPTTTHNYSIGGDYTITLTVTDNQGATGSTTQDVTYTSSAAPAIAFRASAGFDGATATPSVTIPASVQAGDELLLFESYASTSVTTSTPTGWTQVGTATASNLTTFVYSKVASAGDAGSTVATSLSASARASLEVAAYANAAPTVEAAKAQSDTNSANHVSPTLLNLAAGSWAITWWGDKSSTNSQWTAPSGVASRTAVYGSGGGAVSALLVDSNAAVAGSYGGLAATTNVTSGSAVSWTVALANAG
jgi:hypothetical protein